MSISIQTRLVACTVGLGLALGAIGASGWLGMIKGSEISSNLVTRHIEPIRDLKVVADMYAVNIVDTTHKLGFGSLDWAGARANLEAAQTALHKSWADFEIAFKDDPEPGDAELVKSAQAEMAKADEAVARLQSILASEDAVALEQFRTQEMYPAIDPVSNTVGALVESKIKGGQEDQAAYESDEGLLQAIVAALAILSALMVGASLWIVIRQVTGPINQLTDTMRRLAGGDNSVAIPGEKRRDEIGRMAQSVLTFRQNAIDKIALEKETENQRLAAERERAQNEAEKAREAAQDAATIAALAQGLAAMAAGDLTHRIDAEIAPKSQKLKEDFNKAIEQLEETVTVIASNASGIQTGAGEISQAADDLSRRTEQQAATLEETAAALDEITATVKKTATGAIQANVVVGNARADAEASGDVVRSAVSAMGEIENSAQKISQIIGVIDEIAFQTNLLALNAGVEAARAGDAGRGFAVVASEVRALAQRSADAAKEIKSLIHASTSQVEEGVELVGQTGAALQRIVKQVAEITTLVSEISASAQEQSTALGQVNTAVNQMDQVTQQNAAMVEQSTAASHSLAQESAELNRLVGRFRVSSMQAPATPARAQPRRPAATQMRTTSQRKVLPAPAAAEAEWEEF